MAINAETGKPRGFCFVEYEDAATALSAIRAPPSHVRQLQRADAL